jgi:hypothetical protein
LMIGKKGAPTSPPDPPRRHPTRAHRSHSADRLCLLRRRPQSHWCAVAWAVTPLRERARWWRSSGKAARGRRDRRQTWRWRVELEPVGVAEWRWCDFSEYGVSRLSIASGFQWKFTIPALKANFQKQP